MCNAGKRSRVESLSRETANGAAGTYRAVPRGHLRPPGVNPDRETFDANGARCPKRHLRKSLAEVIAQLRCVTKQAIFVFPR
jgi:hypothetical protein